MGTYFLYLRKKADVYSQLEPGLFDKREERRGVIEGTGNSEIFVLMEQCFDVQKHINGINSKYKGRNKSAELIQVIFTMLLKTYLFCYTTVSTCVKVLFSTAPPT